MLPPVECCQTWETPLCKLLSVKSISQVAVITNISIPACKTFIPIVAVAVFAALQVNTPKIATESFK